MCPWSALSARLPECPSNDLGARVSEYLECPSVSVSQLVCDPVSHLVYNAGSVS